MRIKSEEKIADIPILSVRKLFMTRADSISEERIVSLLRVKPPVARKLIRELERQKFIEKGKTFNEELIWVATMKGRALGLSSAAKPIRRKTAEVRLKEFLDRVQEIKNDEHFIYKVRRAWVFGSYLSDAESLGDVDLAIEIAPKIFGEPFDRIIQKKMDQSHKAGKRFSTILEQAVWPQKEVWLKLKSKSRSLSLHPYLKDMENFSKHELIYEDLE